MDPNATDRTFGSNMQQVVSPSALGLAPIPFTMTGSALRFLQPIPSDISPEGEVLISCSNLEVFYKIGIRNVLLLIQKPELKQHIPGIGCLALILESHLMSLKSQEKIEKSESYEFLLEYQEAVHYLLEEPTAEKVAQIIQRLDDAFEQIPLFLDRAPIELPSLLGRFGLQDLVLAQQSSSKAMEKVLKTPQPEKKILTIADASANSGTPSTYRKADCQTKGHSASGATATDKKRIKLAKPHVVLNSTLNTDGFNFPKKTKMAKKVVSDPPKISTSNAFAALENESMKSKVENESMKSKVENESMKSKVENESMETSDSAQAGASTSVQASNSARGNPAEPAQVTLPTTGKVMPIFIYMTENFREILRAIDQISEEKFGKKVVDDLLKITPASHAHHWAIEQFLINQKVKFFGMKPKANRPRKVVIRGLPADTNISEIKNELASMGFEVHRIVPMRDFKTKKTLPLFLCDIFRNEQFVQIYEITELLDYLVNVRLYRSARAKICFRCQRYGHSSDLCSLDFVCMKCGGNHQSRGCNVPRDKIKCPNCSLNHVSNYAKCPKNPKVILELKKKKQLEAAEAKKNPSKKPTTKSRQEPRQAPPQKDDANFPPLAPARRPWTKKVTTPAAEASTPLPELLQTDQLDSTISKLEKVFDLLQGIKRLSDEIASNPGVLAQLNIPIFQGVLKQD